MRSNRIGVLAALLVVPAWMTARIASVPTPTVTGPIPSSAPPGDPSRNYPFFSTKDLAEKQDYVEEEFFVEGLATQYVRDGESTASVAPGGPHPYKTRVIVRRPRSSRRFNGTVILEWINVVPVRPYDFETDWNLTNEHLMRRGFAHVGVSAQRLGIHSPTGLRAWNPARYGSLNITAVGTTVMDQLSVAIFSQVAQALKKPSGTSLLATLKVNNVIATGQSAAAGQLRGYYNSIHPLDSIVDGFILHGGGGPLRTDIHTPVFKLLAETDVIRAQAAMRQPDSDYVRTWEVAGASHLDVDVMSAHDRLQARDLPSARNDALAPCTNLSPSRVPARLVQDAVYDWMKQWVEGKAQPPRAPPITIASMGTPPQGRGGRGGRGAGVATEGTAEERFSVVERDERGNALGGIRLAQFAVPTATNTGGNEQSGLCFNFGSHKPFDDEMIARLYPTRAMYIVAVNRITDDNLKAGYITREGAAQTKKEAAQWKGPAGK